MTNHPSLTLQAHLLQTARTCKRPALFAHHVNLMCHYDALRCMDVDSERFWTVYAEASRAHRKARRAIRQYIEMKRLYWIQREYERRKLA